MKTVETYIKRGVILQVLTESIMVSVLSLPVTLMLFEILKPYISEYFDRSFRINYFHDWQYLIGFMVIVLFVGVFSGLNSALIASKYAPVDILNSQSRIKSSKSYFRRALITFQFVIFTGMLVCSYVIYNQMNYLKNADLGYNKSNLVAVAIPFGKYNDEGRNIVNELKRNPHIIDASITSPIPPSFGNRVTRARASMNNQGKEIVQYQFLECDENYKNVLGLEM
jgi:putative ABC transport system permease protein